MIHDFIIRHGRKIIIALPMLWLGVFFLAPLLQMLAISLTEMRGTIPPYAPLVEYDETQGGFSTNFNLANYALLFDNWRDYIFPALNSLRLAAMSTLCCLFFAYPIAWWIARSSGAVRAVLLVLVLLPFWTSSLILVYAIINLLSHNGYINNALMFAGIIESPLPMLQTDFAIAMGMLITYLPLMVLPLYAVLARLDMAQLEAAADLGARGFVIFRTIILPRSMGGIIAGCVLVFIAATSEFVIPFLLGGPDQIMIGRVLWDEFFRNRDWPVASALAMLMLGMVLLPVLFLRGRDALLHDSGRA